MREGKQLSIQQITLLVSPVTVQEIEKALKSIGEFKAPGINGYMSKFFKATWSIVKCDVTAAVQKYFEKYTMYKPINRALVTLI